jgi:hypothetical protein
MSRVATNRDQAPMANGVSHWPVVRDKPGFLHRLMDELAGDARISLEGDLSRCKFSEDLIVSRAETECLKRNTTWPLQDFVVLRLTTETVAAIFKQVMAAGLKRAILHVQIERNGVRELGAYDHFHPECVFTGPGVRKSLLEELKLKSILRDFRVAVANG